MERFTFEQTMDGGQYLFFIDEIQIGEITFRQLSHDEISINHTYVDTQFEGQGFGKKLVNKVMQYAKDNDLNLSATCWFADKLISK